MLRELFTSRLVLGGLIVCVLIITVSLFWSHHVERDLRESEAETRRFVQQLEKGEASPHRAEQTVTVAVQGQADSPLAPEDFSPMEEDADDTLSMDTAVPIADAETELFLEESVDEDATVEVPVSLFGFGPYPDIPGDYPEQDVWEWVEKLAEDDPRLAKEVELMARVCIKLWEEGQETDGASYNHTTGLIYPSLPDVIYVRWSEEPLPDGTTLRYASRVRGGAAAADPENLRYLDELGIAPPGITVLDFDTEGIDPFTFLDLN